MAWSLRPVTVGDRDFLWALHEQTMREHVEAVWGWDDAFQLRYFDEHFDPEGPTQIIQVGGSDVGMVDVRRRANDLLLTNIRVSPGWQGRGIGTAVIRSVVAGADRPVVLKVLKVNKRAARLYEREGFRVFDETDTHLWMRAGEASSRS